MFHRHLGQYGICPAVLAQQEELSEKSSQNLIHDLGQVTFIKVI